LAQASIDSSRTGVRKDPRGCEEMLQRCVATNRCCPNLTESEIQAAPHDPTDPRLSANLYCNPYLQEELGSSAAWLSAVDGNPSDFPTSALALMYAPPLDERDREAHEADRLSDDCNLEDDDDWMQDGSYPIGVGNIERLLANPSKPSRSPSPMRPGSVQQRTPRTFVATPPAEQQNRQCPRPETPRQSEGDSGDVDPKLIMESTRPSVTTATQSQREPSSGWLSRESSRWSAGKGAAGHPGGADVGALTIASINRCVAKAQGLPEQQRPNSDKWVDRWEALKGEKELTS